MGLLYMANVEHEQHVKYLAEAAKLLGQEALLIKVNIEIVLPLGSFPQLP